jgi:glycosyltransferase involved in cell wall biosynthesis
LVISNLEYGGAQRQVVELANAMNADGARAYVCSLSDYVPLAQQLHCADEVLRVVDKRCKFDLTVVPRLADVLRRLRVDVVHAFLFDAEIAARLAGRLLAPVAVIGSERNTDYTRKWRHSIALRMTQHCADATIANSHSGKRFQIRTLGVPAHKLFVVHNGVDSEHFAPQQCDKLSCLREELGFMSTAKIVGMFSSFKRQKNHSMFFRMAKRVLKVDPNVRFLCVGDELHRGLQGSDRYRGDMLTMVKDLGLSEAVTFLGNREDVVDLYGICAVTVLTSSREGTPNVLLESMACGVPVVATDVADNVIVVRDGHTGYIVPYDDDREMARCVSQLLGNDAGRLAMGRAARDWVGSNFSLNALRRKTIAVYEEVLRRRQGKLTA